MSSHSTRPVSLPTELWDIIVEMMVDAILADDVVDPTSWHDLARLSWTCRDAHSAAHGLLWRHLRLVFRIEGETNLQVQPNDFTMDRFTQMLQWDLHASVFQSSVFPRYRKGQTCEEDDERLTRIRQVSAEYIHLQPFVVLDGKLYMASLLESERNPDAPNLAGLKSLWGDSAPTEADVRITGGLVLVPYPMQLVQELTIDATSSYGDFAYHEPVGHDDLCDALPFLLAMDTNHIRDFNFYVSGGSQGSAALYKTIGRHYQGVINHRYFFGEGIYDGPTFGDSTRTVRIFNHGDMEDNGEMEVCQKIGELPFVEVFELCGCGSFSVNFGLFSSTTLTSLVLDYTLDSHARNDHPFPMHMPSLEKLSLNFEIAQLVFSQQHMASTFAVSSDVIFPTLTHLSLLDIFAWGRDNDPLHFIPWVPYYHMPALTHLHVPLGHRGFTYTHRMVPAHLQSLFAETRIESFVAPALAGFAQVDGDPEPLEALPTASYLKHLDISIAVAHAFPAYIDVPNVPLRLKLWATDQCDEVALFSHLRDLDQLHLDVHGFSNDWWPILARQLNNLQQLTIVDHTDGNSGAESDPVEPIGGAPLDANPQEAAQAGGTAVTDVATISSGAPIAILCNLKHLSFTKYGFGCKLERVHLPNLTHLDLTADHACSLSSLISASDNLESITIASSQCPCQVACVLDSIPAHCHVKLSPLGAHDTVEIKCSVGELRMRFAGDTNRHVWRALLGRGGFVGRGAVKDRVVVELDPSMVATVVDEDARLIARVLAHLLSHQQDEMFSIVLRCGEDVVGKRMLVKLVREIQGQSIKCCIDSCGW